MAKAKLPEIDWIKAVCLERKEALNWTYDELGSAIGYSSAYVRQMFSTAPDEWPRAFRAEIFRVFGIDSKTRQKIILLLE